MATFRLLQIRVKTAGNGRIASMPPSAQIRIKQTPPREDSRGASRGNPIRLLLRVIGQVTKGPRFFVASLVGAISFGTARVAVLALGVLGAGRGSVGQATVGLAIVLSTAGKQSGQCQSR
jgi:hypothetical protein